MGSVPEEPPAQRGLPDVDDNAVPAFIPASLAALTRYTEPSRQAVAPPVWTANAMVTESTWVADVNAPTENLMPLRQIEFCVALWSPSKPPWLTPVPLVTVCVVPS